MNTSNIANNVNVAATITAGDIINSGKWEETEHFSAEKHIQIIMDFGRSGILKDTLTAQQIANLAGFFCVTRFEQSALMWWIMGDKSHSLMNVIAFHQCRVPNSSRCPSIHLQYMHKNESKDENDTYFARALRSIGIDYKPNTEYKYSNYKESNEVV